MYRKNLCNAIAALLAVASMSSAVAANIIIDNIDRPGQGLNDPTIVSPVAGNPGTTLGAQRQFVLQTAANYWGAKLRSNVDIHVDASFRVAGCRPGDGLFAIRSTNLVANIYAGSPVSYPIALANALIGEDVNGGASEITAIFSTADDRRCYPTISGYWYGVSPSHAPTGFVSLFEESVNAFAGSLGFRSEMNFASREFIMGIPSHFSQWVFDQSTGKYLSEMTLDERVAAVNPNIVWGGINVYAHQSEYLRELEPAFTITAPPAIAGPYAADEARFGPRLVGLNGRIVAAVDEANSAGPSTTDGCSSISNASQIAGNIALLDRGACVFTTKVRNAQQAGAVAVVIVNNTPGPLNSIGGSDSLVTIPVYGVSQITGDAIRMQLPMSEVTVSLGYSGTLNGGLIRLDASYGMGQFTPESHLDYVPQLTPFLLRDLGWELITDGKP